MTEEASVAQQRTSVPHQRQADILDPDRLAALQAVQGGPEFIMGRILAEHEYQMKRQTVEDEREYKLRLLTIWLTVAVIFGITGASAGVILAGHEVAGGVLATADLVALANVLINSIRRR